jgi:hypothetical protein
MTRRTGRRRARSPETEQLEHRCLLAGNVLVAVNGGELDITGDNAGNGILITLGTGHQFTVRGFADNGDTTVNGKAFVNVDGVNGDVKVNLGGGDDILSVFNTTTALVLPKDLRISLGSGNDLVILANVTVKGGLEIRNGSASGRETISLEDVAVWSDAKFETGAGNDTVQIADSSFRGELEVRLGAGNDSLSVANSQVRDDFKVDGGDGFDTFSSENNIFRRDVEIKNIESND